MAVLLLRGRCLHRSNPRSANHVTGHLPTSLNKMLDAHTMFSLRHSFRQIPCSRSRLVHSTTASPRPIPEPRGKIATPQDFLKAIGRNSEKRVSIDSWEAFWRTTGWELKSASVPVRDRRYILWCMEKFRQDIPIEQFAHEPRPKKKIRGWGPAVQHGKRIR